MTDSTATGGAGRSVLLVLSWVVLVIIPLLYGVVELILKLGALFS